jgi:eukaryotic-like serine/threonine-protein kinase
LTRFALISPYKREPVEGEIRGETVTHLTRSNSVDGGSLQRRANGSGMGPVLGRYELLMRVGTGGMATVWAARLRGSRGFQKMVALKTILPRFSADPVYERLFLDEARLTAQVRHPNVAQILDLGEDNGMLFLAMEWIEGVSVSELLRAAGETGTQIPLSVAIRIVTQAAAGLHAAHELRDAEGELVGLVHRDVSPQNILVSFDGITKVIDFGIAKVVRDGAEDATHSFQVRGKVGYLAPEQIMDGTTDRRADLFALGVVLYVLTAGAHPFEGRGPLATLYNIAQEPFTRPSTLKKDYPEELEAAVLRCLEKDRARRFATCDELVWTLESSIPADLRATDQDVAEFVRSLAGNLGAQRWRALELAAVESGTFGGRTQAPPPQIVEQDEGSLPLTSGRLAEVPRVSVEPTRRASSALGLFMWGAVFIASLWLLVTEWRSEPALVPPPEPQPQRVARAPLACPPPATSSAPAAPATIATSSLTRPQRLSNRSPNK